MKDVIKKKNLSFTLVELLIVIAIIAILASMPPLLRIAQDKMKCISNIGQAVVSCGAGHIV